MQKREVTLRDSGFRGGQITQTFFRTGDCLFPPKVFGFCLSASLSHVKKFFQTLGNSLRESSTPLTVPQGLFQRVLHQKRQITETVFQTSDSSTRGFFFGAMPIPLAVLVPKILTGNWQFNERFFQTCACAPRVVSVQKF